MRKIQEYVRTQGDTLLEVIKNRYEFVIIYDVENGNPNGDPDAGNMPRIDPATQLGIVTHECIKHKIRNYIEILKEDASGYRIYQKSHAILDNLNKEAYVALNINMDKSSDSKKGKKDKKDKAELDRGELSTMVRDWMCKNYYDIRTFGAVMTTFKKDDLNCGQVTGPVQICDSNSVEPIMPQQITITRMALANEKEAADKDNTMGSKYIIPYGLYRCDGFISANLARKTTHFTEGDLELLWDAIMNMFEHDHSAARGKMAVRKLIIFKHDSELGNAPSHKLLEAVTITRKDPDSTNEARSFKDYEVKINEEAIPDGVNVFVRE